MAGRTPPEQIRNPDYRRIYERLTGLDYPCTLVVYGPERTHRTTFRGENGSAFALAYCQDAAAAWAVVDCGFRGHPSELQIHAIPGAPTPVPTC